MFETYISIYNPNGVYPKQSVLCDTVGYSYFKNIPLYLRVLDLNNKYGFRKDTNEVLIHASFLLTKREFPAFNFYNLGEGSIIIKSESKPKLSEILTQAKAILKFSKKVPILYNPYDYNYTNYRDAQEKIKVIRANKEYIDLFHCKKRPLKKQVDIWSRSFEFSKHKPSVLAVKRYYNMLEKSSRFIHIALYYFITASRLMHNNFIEDGGLNLQLTVEALIRDFMELHSIKKKNVTIEQFIANVALPHFHMEFLEELYDARNEFLAHIDEDMFTQEQNIDDPDRYCYEHFESVSWLITRYIRYKNRINKKAI